MTEIMAIAKRHGLKVVEDAAQAVGTSYHNKPLGSFGDFAAYSFHASKIITSGEGGALLVKHKRDVEHAEIMWEKGTNRAALIRGEVDKYTWADIGSSFLMSDVSAALLWSQLRIMRPIIRARLKVWDIYHKALAPLEARGMLRRPIIPKECQHNGHIYYLLLKNEKQRESLRKHLARDGIEACFHYVPLHSSPAGKKFGRTATSMAVTNHTSSTLLRLPLYPQLGHAEQMRIVGSIFGFFDAQ
jgi:dTDP-4-amino-4,6-dideoxygalactose transaminase